jgi:AcrR family transcriptional regulator
MLSCRVAYEVTKRLGTREYRYRVEGRRDPETGRVASRWTYLGRIGEDGQVVAPEAREARQAATRERIISSTAALLEQRDAARVTVAVIATRAEISEATFYRYFPHRRDAFTAALAFTYDRVVMGLPSLDGPLGTLDAERARMQEWMRSLHRSLLRERAVRWSFGTSENNRLKTRIERSLLKVDARALLADYLGRLQAAGIAQGGDPAALAAGMMALLRLIIQSETTGTDTEPPLDELRVLVERAVFGTSP